jgi:TRAP-type mannitol/chloroaromatic compound transport system permease small subunit
MMRGPSGISRGSNQFIKLKEVLAVEENKWLAMSKKIDRINEWIGRIFCFFVLPLTLVMVYEVVVRALGSPTLVSFELSNFFFGTHFMMLAAYGLLHNSHVSIDIFSSRFSPRTQAKILIFGYITMFFPFIIMLLYYGSIFAIRSWVTWENSWSLWGPPIYPFKTVIPLTAALLLLQGISEVIKKIAYLSTKEVAK